MDPLNKQYIIQQLTTILTTLQQQISQHQSKYHKQIQKLNQIIYNKDQIIKELNQSIYKIQRQYKKKQERSSQKVVRKIVVNLKNKNTISSFDINKKKETKVKAQRVDKQNKTQQNITCRLQKNKRSNTNTAIPLRDNININNYNSQNTSNLIYSITSPKSNSIQRPFSNKSISNMINSVPNKQSQGMNYSCKMIKSTVITPFYKSKSKSKSKVKNQRCISTIIGDNKSKSKSKKKGQNFQYMQNKQKRMINLIVPA